VIGDISVRRVAGKLHFAVHQQSFVDVLPQVRAHASRSLQLPELACSLCLKSFLQHCMSPVASAHSS
jgi:hypothetical protein